MKILQLCKKFPYPVKDGESLAILNLSRSLATNNCTVSLLAMNTSRHQVQPELDNSKLAHYQYIDVVDVDNRIKPFEAFLNLFSSESYHIVRFISDVFRERLIELLQRVDFDVIQLETLYLTPYIDTIRQYSEATIALRAHNIEHEIWERITFNTSNTIKKSYLKYLTAKLKKFELAQLGRFDVLVAISERDRSKFRTFTDIQINEDVTIPIGLKAEQYQPDYNHFQKPFSLSFIGSLDWMPNIEGISWFLDHIWPAIRSVYPEIRLYIAGRNCPDWLKNANIDGVVVVGEVENAKDFINDHPIMVVPLLSGSGMRVKILEGMALGRVVVTTTVGLEGINAKDFEEVIIADTPAAYLHALEHLSKDQEAIQLGQRARAFIEEYFDSDKIANQLKHTYRQIKS